jgi:hypothetical protein
MADQILTQDFVTSLFLYKNDNLYWKKSKPGRQINKPAGTFNKKGYRYVMINGKLYLAHRLIFLMFNGYLPKEVDHINGKSNNIKNLRPATHSQNCHNQGLKKTNTSGFKGVGWSKKYKKWRVRVTINSKEIDFGCFEDIELADLVAQEARNKHHKEFAKHF